MGGGNLHFAHPTVGASLQVHWGMADISRAHLSYPPNDAVHTVFEAIISRRTRMALT